MDLVKLLIAVFFTIFATLCIWYKLLNKRIDYNNPKFYLTLVCLMIIALINYFNVNAYIRITIVTLALMIFFRFLFKENIQRCIITPIISQMIVMISEMIFVVTVSILFNMNNDGIINTQFGTLLSNLFIAVISLLIVNIPIFSKLYNFLIRITDRINRNKLIIFSLFIIVIANLLTMFLYYRVEFIYLLIFNTSLILFFLSIVIYSFKTQDNYIKVYDKYNTTLNSLRTGTMYYAKVRAYKIINGQTIYGEYSEEIKISVNNGGTIENLGKVMDFRAINNLKHKCLICNNEIEINSLFCKDCYNKYNKKSIFLKVNNLSDI